MTARKTDGFTLIEILFVVAVIGILAAVAAPALSRTKMAANESSAIASIRAVHSGQQTFWASCGSGNYSPTLDNLGMPIAGMPGFVSEDLSSAPTVVKSGYEIDMDSVNPTTGSSCNGGGLVVTYHVTADPQPGKGRRYFGANASGAIYQSTATLFGGGMPDTGVPAAPAVPIQQ